MNEQQETIEFHRNQGSEDTGGGGQREENVYAGPEPKWLSTQLLMEQARDKDDASAALLNASAPPPATTCCDGLLNSLFLLTAPPSSSTDEPANRTKSKRLRRR
ncbi:hypothetical protein L6452_05290 [Arctium lappa]|uniref:Uncharacterized protein n=1 Tax=Arctium lappa TaxID=4217 RepID=A0ACB9EFZ3_ARCLA|nr:hypothetical protein L6452_05290 [Arctium lappa]